MNNLSHTGKTALITGASSGIGYELARCFAEDGFNLIVVSRHRKPLEKIAREFSGQYGVTVTPISKSLFQREAATELYQEVKKRNLSVDVLVNDAGQGEWEEFAKGNLQQQLDIIEYNITALSTLSYLFSQDMKTEANSRILNLGSFVSSTQTNNKQVQITSETALPSFTEVIYNEMKGDNITIATLMPA